MFLENSWFSTLNTSRSRPQWLSTLSIHNHNSS